MKDLVNQLAELQTIEGDIDRLKNIVNDLELLTSNEANRMANLWYGSLRNFARNHDQAAIAILNILREFHTTTRADFPNKPKSKRQLKREINSLLRGTRDGTITISRSPDEKTRGELTITDDSETARNAAREDENQEGPPISETPRPPAEEGQVGGNQNAASGSSLIDINAKLVKICPHCQCKNESDANHCKNCGIKLALMP
jgi:hypothetical protein